MPLSLGLRCCVGSVASKNNREGGQRGHPGIAVLERQQTYRSCAHDTITPPEMTCVYDASKQPAGRGPQSVQSVPLAHDAYSAPGPPSLQFALFANSHESSQPSLRATAHGLDRVDGRRGTSGARPSLGGRRTDQLAHTGSRHDGSSTHDARYDVSQHGMTGTYERTLRNPCCVTEELTSSICIWFC